MIIKGRNKKTNKIYNKVYQLWYNMKQRCYNPKNPYYKNYGAKNIIICDRWLDLNNFIEDVDKIKGFDKKLFLDGKLCLDKDTKNLDNNIYSLEKCEFISFKISNQRKSHQQKFFKAISPNGKEYIEYNQAKFARKHNLNQNNISACLLNKRKSHKGWRFISIN